MSRPVRKKQLPNKLDPSLFVISWKSQRTEKDKDSNEPTCSQGTRKKQISSTPRVLSSRLRPRTAATTSQNTVLAKNDSQNIDQVVEHSETDSSSGNGKSQTPVIRNKFFKSKEPGGGSSQKIHLRKRVVLKNRKNNHKQTKTEDPVDFLPALRQTTLSESFKRNSKYSRLRPRKIDKFSKDSPDVTVLLEKSISPDKRKSLVLLERFDRKVPVYKSVELPEKNVNGKESVYEFEFDANDPGEKKNGNKTRKKKRVPRKAAPTRKKKVLSKKESDMPKTLVESSGNSAATEKNKKDVASCNRVEGRELPHVGVGNEKKNTAGCDHGENNELPRLENQNNRNGIPKCEQGKQTEPSPDVGIETINQSPTKEIVCPEILPLRENLRIKNTKPKISSMETLTGDRKVSFKPALSPTRQNSTKFNPFRSTQSIFKPRPTLNPKDMLDHSLLNKSLSPIKHNTENFDVASPWRPQLGNAFFSVKQLVQSTPRVDRNLVRPSLAESKQTQRILENDENENITEVEEGKISSTIEQSDKKRLLKPLGNRISNAENIQAGSNTKVDVSKIIGERKAFGQSLSYGENKQRIGFGDRLYKSPIKNDKAMTTNRGSIGLKMRNQEPPAPASLIKKSEPQPSAHDNDYENLPPVEELKLMKQTTLNSFLNIDDVPESTTINTNHGIFGDANSTPMVSSKVQAQATVENCFGFDEDYSDGSESPVKLDDKNKRTTPVKKVFERLKERVLPLQTEPASSSVKKPARISLGEIKNTLHPRQKINSNYPGSKEEKQKKKPLIGTVEVYGEKKTDDQSKDVQNAAQFCDTFDILSQSEHGTGTEKSVAEVGLFADLEPVHFKQPPRWSYAKKRERTECWSSEDEENRDDQEERPVMKKKKLTKQKLANDKKIDDWVKSVNDTFQEIDEYDLIVEKRS